MPEPPRNGPATWKMLLAGTVILALSGGWFALSRWDMGSQVVDALGEAVGVALALLVVVSLIGAVLNRDRD